VADGVDQHLGLDELDPRPLGLVSIEWRRHDAEIEMGEGPELPRREQPVQ